MEKEGVIKFNLLQLSDDYPNQGLLEDINEARNYCIENQFIGMAYDGIGYGNVSQRIDNQSFIISASQTGHLTLLSSDFYCIIVDWDFNQNQLTYKGLHKPSSESLTHAAIYEICPEVYSVIHIHNLSLWTQLLNKVPTTSKNVEYGSVRMANEIKIKAVECKEIFKNESGVIVMEGHYTGIVIFGKDFKQIKSLIDSYLK